VQDVNPNNPLGSQGKLATAFAQHCKQCDRASGTAEHYESPKELKQSIVNKFDQFAGRRQHDAQELLVNGLFPSFSLSALM
jgi:hypothetical protein